MLIAFGIACFIAGVLVSGILAACIVAVFCHNAMKASD